jgi:putative chitinase
MRKLWLFPMVVLGMGLLLPTMAGAWGGPTTYTMQKGDTLWELAAKNYGDPTLYPVFLEVNDITNVRSIPVGKEIIIPSLTEMQKISKELDPDKRKELIKNIKGDSGGNSLDKPLLGGTTGSPGSTEPDPSGFVPSDGPIKVSFQDVLEGPRVKGEHLKSVETNRK